MVGKLKAGAIRRTFLCLVTRMALLIAWAAAHGRCNLSEKPCLSEATGQLAQVGLNLNQGVSMVRKGCNMLENVV